MLRKRVHDVKKLKNPEHFNAPNSAADRKKRSSKKDSIDGSEREL